MSPLRTPPPAPDSLSPADGIVGTKLVLLRGDRLLVCLRDDYDHIPFPAHWDLPGGGREQGETVVECALRELHEEFGLTLTPDRLLVRVDFDSLVTLGWRSAFFGGWLTRAECSAIRFGDEGQEWRMMPLAEYGSHPRAVPHFPWRVRRLVAALQEYAERQNFEEAAPLPGRDRP